MSGLFIWLVYAGFVALFGGYALHLRRAARRLAEDES